MPSTHLTKEESMKKTYDLIREKITLQRFSLGLTAVFLLVSLSACGWHNPYYHHKYGNQGYSSETGQDNDNALKILRERYARGEISADEFGRMKSELEK